MPRMKHTALIGRPSRHRHLTGKVIGLWTIGLRDTRNIMQGIRYWCTCSCGAVVSVAAKNLDAGRSYGCRACRIAEGKVEQKKASPIRAIEQILNTHTDLCSLSVFFLKTAAYVHAKNTQLKKVFPEPYHKDIDQEMTEMVMEVIDNAFKDIK